LLFLRLLIAKFEDSKIEKDSSFAVLLRKTVPDIGLINIHLMEAWLDIDGVKSFTPEMLLAMAARPYYSRVDLSPFFNRLVVEQPPEFWESIVVRFEAMGNASDPSVLESTFKELQSRGSLQKFSNTCYWNFIIRHLRRSPEWSTRTENSLDKIIAILATAEPDSPVDRIRVAIAALRSQ
jgi:hypothetical protein